ncbi:MAG: hypothetical protein JSS86_21030, partial [Cyanobacteria bacterium SZAS LIN-2]|nr:hypothetical protein [Cyanobacteria bacterium SZAS LIN-2]
MINIEQEFDKTPHQTYIDSSHALVAAAAARKQKLYARACALYFAAAYEPLSRGKLSEAKPVLDAAFALAPQVSPANRSEIFSVVNRFANDLRDSKMSADCRLYLSQKFLNMCRRDKATSEESLSYATESVAFDCFESAQYGRSALLFEGLIARLEASHPIDHRIREWLLLLCRIYEADKKPLLAEQTYKRLIKFGRATYPEEIADDLEIYDFFLIRQHKFKEAIPVSKELLTAAVKPHQLSRLGRRDWLGLAASLESVNGNLAAEFYKVAFDLGAGKYPSAGAFSKRRLADVAFQWSAMLRDKGRNAESLAVLDMAIELTQATSSAQSAREMQRLLDCREQRLLAMGRVAEARKQAALREKFEQDIQTWERVQEAHNNRAIIEAAASPQAPSIAKIKGLTAEAYAAAEAGNCRGGLSKLSAALDLYDRSVPAEISSASECFTDIGLRFKSCLTDKEAVEILVRILRRYLTVGLPEAEFTSREYIAHFPFSRV